MRSAFAVAIGAVMVGCVAGGTDDGDDVDTTTTAQTVEAPPPLDCPGPDELADPDVAAVLQQVSDMLAPDAIPRVIRVAVVLVDYTNHPLACGRDQVDRAVFGEIDSLRAAYEESSFGKAHVQGTVFGPFPLAYRDDDYCVPVWSPVSAQVLDGGHQMLAGALAALSHGVPLGSYDRLVVMAPEKAWWCQTVPWAGPTRGNRGAVVLSDNAVTVIAGGAPACAHAKLLAHEFGHTSRFDHAGDATGEYGDWSDDMGAPSSWFPEPTGYVQFPLIQYDAIRKLQLGWLPAGKVVQPPIGAERTYELQASEVNPASTERPALIRIPIPDTTDGKGYYIQYRAPIGVDAALLPQFRNRVQIKTASGVAPAPQTPFHSRTFRVVDLGPGDLYTEAAGQFTVHVDSVGASSARVSVRRTY